jgi:hypothetical protein
MLTFLAETRRNQHENPYTNQDKDDAGYDSEKELVANNHRGNYRKSKDRDRRVKGIGGRYAQAGDNPMESTISNSPLDAQQRDRADRYRKGKPDNYSLDKDTEIHMAPGEYENLPQAPASGDSGGRTGIFSTRPHTMR